MIAKITKKKEVAQGTLRVEFATPEFDFKPGQYMVVTLINPPETDAEGDSRYYSIVNSPTEKGKLVLTTRLRDTAFKRVLKNLPLGAKVEIDQIGGKFLLPENTNTPLVFIAGGIGITPFMSMMHYIADKKLTYQVTLIYSNRDKASTAYFDDLSSLAKENKNLRVIFVMTKDETWSGEKGHLDREKINKYFVSPNENLFYIAGPPPMVKAIYQAVRDSGVEAAHIKTENFDGYEAPVARLQTNPGK